MDIRFISSLTSEDENRIASALFGALATPLDNLAIPYSLQISASGGEVYRRGRDTSSEGSDAVREPDPQATASARVYTGSGDTEGRRAIAGRAGR